MGLIPGEEDLPLEGEEGEKVDRPQEEEKLGERLFHRWSLPSQEGQEEKEEERQEKDPGSGKSIPGVERVHQEEGKEEKGGGRPPQGLKDRLFPSQEEGRRRQEEEEESPPGFEPEETQDQEEVQREVEPSEMSHHSYRRDKG